MATSDFLSTLVFVAVLAVVIRKIMSVILRYKHTLDVTRNIVGLPGTRLIWGDLKTYPDYRAFVDASVKQVQGTRCKMHKVWMFFLHPIINFDHPDVIKPLLKSSAPKPDGMMAGYRMLKGWLGDGLILIQGGPKWERNRHLLTPAFHFEILQQYVIEFNHVANIFLKRLETASSSGKSVEITQIVTLATLDSLLRCALSYEGDIQKEGYDHPYVSAVKRLSSLYMLRIANPVMYPDFIYHHTTRGKEFQKLCQYVHGFAEDIIKRRRKSLGNKTNDDESLQNGKNRLDFLDILLRARDENGIGLSDKEIRAEVDTFMFAGHDTTSSAISWAVYSLAKYPEIQEKVFQEVNDVVTDDNVRWEDISKLKYLTSLLKENMRMNSIVPQIGRELKEPLAVDGIELPVGTLVEINFYCLNNHPDVWPDHMEFKPERFSDEVQSERDPFAYVPFSAGSRNCIGQNFALNEQKIIIARLVKRFKIKLDSNHDVIQTPYLVLRAETGIKVFLEER